MHDFDTRWVIWPITNASSSCTARWGFIHSSSAKYIEKTPGAYVYPYLLTGMNVTAPNQVWAADITYIPMPVGFLYKFAIIDLFSRYLVGWGISSTMEASWCSQVYKECLRRHCYPGIINTDQGSQFTSNEWVDTVKESGAKISMDGKNRAIDNVFIERYWRSLKYEWVYTHPAATGQELYGGLTSYVRYYNEERLHSSLYHQLRVQFTARRSSLDSQFKTEKEILRIPKFLSE